MDHKAWGGNWYRGAANWLENRLNGTLAKDEPHDDRAMMRDAMAKLNQAADEIDRLHQIERLAERFVQAKGRYHSQQAMCDLLEHFGKPCVRPEEDAAQPEGMVSVPREATEQMIVAAECMNASDYERPANVWRVMMAALERGEG